MYRNAYAGAKKYKAGISPPVRRVSRQATGGSRGDVVTVSHLRHWSPCRARQGVGMWVRDVSAGRGRCSQHPQHHVSRGVADHEGGPAFTPTQQPPTCRLGGGGRAGPQGGGGGAGQEATGGSRGDVVTVSHLRHLVTLAGATGCGYVMYQRGGGAARSTPNITSLGVWRTMRAALPSRPLSSPPPAGWAAGAGPGLRGAVAGQDRR
ncbi:hypothetical protein GWK47_035479 [Chionoecetes opilio]|uniref:Uncharacterized protein n=1 Tax=Chionoecetes opilio TaxID=41210 RepID=A0A8J4YGT4_CHIOP|nr:hypothetical protein GWK47_035479 [Chionoecetes opilio]